MNLPRFGLTHRAIVLAAALAVLAAGLYNLATMPRREDPEITLRGVLVLTRWAGAPAARVEDLITDPLEAVIAELPQVERMASTSRVGLSIIEIWLDQNVTDPDQVWDDLRARIRRIQPALPSGAEAPVVNTDYGDVYEIQLALYQVPLSGETTITRPYTPRELEVFAEQIEDEVEPIGSVGRVDIWGRQPERIYVEVDSADWAKLDITAQRLREIFLTRNIVIPGGEFDADDSRYTVHPSGEFSSLAQISRLIVDQREGVLPVRLGDLPVRIDRRYKEPPDALVRYSDPTTQHTPALLIAISMKSGRNIADMSEAVDTALADLVARRHMKLS